MTSHQFTSGSGARVTLTSATPFTVERYAAQVRFVASSFTRGFQIGLPGYHHGAEQTLTKPRLVARPVSVHGNEIRISAPEDGSQTIATLISKHHEIQTVFAGRPTTDTVVSLFNGITFTDSPSGAAVKLSTGHLAVVSYEIFVAMIEGIGVVNVTPGTTRGGSRGLATRTKHGSLWRTTDLSSATSPTATVRHSRRNNYFLKFGTADVDLAPYAEGVGDESFLSWLDELSVAWS